jgi:hypothetical protein
MALRYAMAVTGEPQEMFIYDNNAGSGQGRNADAIAETWIPPGIAAGVLAALERGVTA